MTAAARTVTAVALVCLSVIPADAAVADYIGKNVVEVRLQLNGALVQNPELIEIIETRAGTPLATQNAPVQLMVRRIACCAPLVAIVVVVIRTPMFRIMSIGLLSPHETAGNSAPRSHPWTRSETARRPCGRKRNRGFRSELAVARIAPCHLE